MAEETDTAVPSGMKALTKFTAEHAREVGLPSPEAVNYMVSIANMLMDSALVTPDMSPDKATLAELKQNGWTPEQIYAYTTKAVRSNAMAKMLIGREMHMEAMESLQDIDIVKGRIFVRYPQLIAQMIRKGFTVKWIERTNEKAVLEVSRPDTGPEVFEFTIEDAKRAGLTNSSKPEYNQYLLRPRVMLTARVASEAYRTTGGRSNVYTPEEKPEIFPESTLNEPTEADRQRAEVLAAQDEFRVRLKKQPETAPQVVDHVDSDHKNNTPSNLMVMPLPDTSDKTPAKATAEPVAASEIPTPQFVIYLQMKTASGETKAVVVGDEKPQSTKEAALLRAQAIANETGHTYTVYQGESLIGACASQQTRKPGAADTGKPTPVVTPETDPLREQVKARLHALVKILDPSPKAVAKTYISRFNAFVAGYLGISTKSLPKDVKEWLEPVAELESVMARDADEFRAGPEEAGKLAKRRKVQLLDFCTAKWGTQQPAIKDLAFQLARQWSLDTAQFTKFVESNDLDFVPVPDLEAYLRVALKTRDAHKLLKASKDRKVSVVDLVKQVEGWTGPIADALPEHVSKAIDQTLSAKPAATAAPAPQAAPPAEDGLEEAGLFDEI